MPRPSLAVKRKRDLAPLGDVEEWFSKCEAGIVAAINAAYHDGAGADRSTAVGHWVRFTVRGLHTAAIRLLDPSAPIREKLA